MNFLRLKQTDRQDSLHPQLSIHFYLRNIIRQLPSPNTLLQSYSHSSKPSLWKLSLHLEVCPR